MSVSCSVRSIRGCQLGFLEHDFCSRVWGLVEGCSDCRSLDSLQLEFVCVCHEEGRHDAVVDYRADEGFVCMDDEVGARTPVSSLDVPEDVYCFVASGGDCFGMSVYAKGWVEGDS